MGTWPGINSSFDMTAYSAEDQRVIRRFSEYFYVTRAADPVKIGNSAYTAALMRPSDGVAIALNVEREIVVLFADYPTFEARTLNAYEDVYQQFDDARIDKSIRFLISKDQNIQNSISLYLSREPEYPVVIPFLYSDFSPKSEDFIYSAIRRNYIVRDLFGHQSPLKQEYFFFGRDQLAADVVDRHKSGQNSGLFGLRKSGKTSTIYAIQRRAKTAGCRTLLIDCQDPAVHAKRYDKLLQYIITELRTELSLPRIEANLGESVDVISENFRKHMTNSLGQGRADVLIIFDEIENISPKTAASPHWRQEHDSIVFWQILRSFFQNPKKYRITFCFVGTNPHLFETPKINDIDNPVYLFAPKTFIPMLSEAETREMIKKLSFFMGLQFDDTVINHIHNMFGGHPFFIRQLCSNIHRNTTQARPVSVSLMACKQAKQTSWSDIHGYLMEILNTLKFFYSDEYSMIEYLSDGDTSSFKDVANFSPSYVEHLIGYGIVIKRGEDYEFAFEAIANAAKAGEHISSASKSTKEKRDEVSGRRNKIEEDMRVFFYYWSQGIPDDEWEATLNKSLGDERIKKLGTTNRRQLFSKNNSPLFFIDLLKFIDICEQIGTSHHTHSEIKMCIDFVNRHRIDAHAKAVSDSDYYRLVECLDILEATFSAP
ncbi:hypothetical protein FBZ82_11648 [Azospirillum brasilense]|uniref:ATP-binding protein n=1 Tax=Azospirillum brasilense TaxID=192 RepID=A0A560ANV1_AZOBR|nr:ATP-binding protein [Azospirillum brasilense]TWA62035.1 hypothetical protein FBZ82_11648 [Azospirillum brasilense]